MGSKLKLATSLLAVVALALIGTTAAVAENPHATFTCTKTKKNGPPDVRVSVPEPAVSGLTNAGFVCVADAAPAANDDEDEEQSEEQDGEDEGQDEAQDEGEDESEDAHETTGGQEDGSPPGGGSEQSSPELPSATASAPPAESRALYCSTKGPVERGNGELPGVALNLPESQGALLVEKGLATPAIFYAGFGVSCDVLPGFVFSGVWVDNVGDVAPGVGVYPYYLPAG